MKQASPLELVIAPEELVNLHMSGDIYLPTPYEHFTNNKCDVVVVVAIKDDGVSYIANIEQHNGHNNPNMLN
jgi:hypothetical protein